MNFVILYLIYLIICLSITLGIIFVVKKYKDNKPNTPKPNTPKPNTPKPNTPKPNTPKPNPPPPIIKSKWKQVVYVGYSMSYEQFSSFIDTCKQNGITHIILEFIVFGNEMGQTSNANWSELQLYDSFKVWTDFDDTQKQSLLNKLNDITLMASFGGATSFGNFAGSKNVGFQYTWKNSNSKYYVGAGKYDSIQTSATALGKDLATILISNKIKALDFDIENIPTTGSYSGTYSDIYNYLGFMSQAAKENGIITVSHAPQTPYFYPQTNGSWPQLYYNIEKDFGKYIDFYNIQYYNNGDYSSETALFTNDTNFQTSVNQLITGNGIAGLNGIPAYKIVLGQAVDAPWPSSVEQNWKNLATFVQNQKTSSNQNLKDWYNFGGVMAWIYRLDASPNTNQYLLTYFNSLKH